jgi:hypothetical protein
VETYHRERDPAAFFLETAILVLADETGLGPSEIASLDIAHLLPSDSAELRHDDDATITSSGASAGRARTITLGAGARTALSNYLAQERANSSTNSPALFINPGSRERLSRAEIAAIMADRRTEKLTTAPGEALGPAARRQLLHVASGWSREHDCPNPSRISATAAITADVVHALHGPMVTTQSREWIYFVVLEGRFVVRPRAAGPSDPDEPPGLHAFLSIGQNSPLWVGSYVVRPDFPEYFQAGLFTWTELLTHT